MMIKRLFAFIVIVTWIFAQLDWEPIHRSYVQYNDWPHPTVDEWWPKRQRFRYILSHTVCPPCAALAEHYFFVFFELQGSIAERDDLLLKHIPKGYRYEGVWSRSGFWWGQGGPDNSNPWKLVSLPAWYLYWLPYTVLWWIVIGDLFYLRKPWWMQLIQTQRKCIRKNKEKR